MGGGLVVAGQGDDGRAGAQAQVVDGLQAALLGDQCRVLAGLRVGLLDLGQAELQQRQLAGALPARGGQLRQFGRPGALLHPPRPVVGQQGGRLGPAEGVQHLALAFS